MTTETIMDKLIIGKDIMIDEQVNRRFKQGEAKHAEVKDAFDSKDPKRILNMDSDSRVEKRRERLKQNNLEDITIERVIEKSDLMPIYYLEKGRRIANSICRVDIMDINGNTQGYGTGFMVSPSLLITNNHVLGNKEDCKNSLAEFNYEKGENFTNRQQVDFKLDPERFFYTNKELDFSLVAVSPQSVDNKSLEEFKYLKLIKETGKAVIGEYVSIIQHPRGNQKQVAIRENRIINIFDDFVHYVTDTEPGSSGSAVLNDQWEVISLHHSSVPDKDDQGNILTKDKTIWTSDMGEDKINWIGNEGVRISSIVKDLENLLPNIPSQQKPVLEELLQLTV